jgi:NAD(P)H-hydrate epimerase
VDVTLTKPANNFRQVPAHQLDILKKMRINLHDPTQLEDIPQAALILDGIIGYSISGPPHGAAADLIRWANAQPAPILALDLPSGMDASRGAAYDPSIRASATLTLALPKIALRKPDSTDFTDELYLADIGVPPQLYARHPLNLQVGHIFAHSDIVRIF